VRHTLINRSAPQPATRKTPSGGNCLFAAVSARDGRKKKKKTPGKIKTKTKKTHEDGQQDQEKGGTEIASAHRCLNIFSGAFLFLVLRVCRLLLGGKVKERLPGNWCWMKSGSTYCGTSRLHVRCHEVIGWHKVFLIIVGHSDPNMWEEFMA